MAVHHKQADGKTKRRLPADYSGDDPYSCNAPTKSGRPCRARALESGRCKAHGGKGKAKLSARSEQNKRKWIIKHVDEMLARYRRL